MRTRIRYLKHIGVLALTSTLVLGGAATTAVAAPAPPPSPPRAAIPTTVVIDDARTTGADHFSYSRNWRVCTDCDRAALGGSFHYTNRVQASVTLTFTGRRATIYGFTQRAGGTVSVRVDGRSVGVVDLYRDGRRRYTALYTTAWLRPGRHTVTFTVLRKKSGTGRTVIVDKAVITKDRAVPPPPGPTPPPGPVTGPGIASLTFDDGRISQYTTVRPLLDKAGVKATFYIISDGLDWGTKTTMSAAQVGELAGAGYEIGNHTKTHANLTTLSQQAVEAEFTAAQTALKNATGITPTTCAYPYGASNDTVRTVAAKYFTGCRGTSGGMNTASGLARYDLRTFYVTTSTTAAQVRDAAAAAKAQKAWIVFVFHGVGSVSSSDDVSTQSFTDELAAITGTGIPVRTVSAALASML